MKVDLQDTTDPKLLHPLKGDANGLAVNSGEVKVIEVTAVADTSVYANGDVLTDTMTIASALRAAGKGSLLRDLTVVDIDDQTGYAFDVFFFKESESLGAKNAAPNIADGDIVNCIGWVRFAATDVIDVGGAKVYYKSNINLTLIASSGVDVFAQAVILTGTPTHTASGLRFKFGIEQK